MSYTKTPCYWWKAYSNPSRCREFVMLMRMLPCTGPLPTLETTAARTDRCFYVKALEGITITNASMRNTQSLSDDLRLSTKRHCLQYNTRKDINLFLVLWECTDIKKSSILIFYHVSQRPFLNLFPSILVDQSGLNLGSTYMNLGTIFVYFYLTIGPESGQKVL